MFDEVITKLIEEVSLEGNQGCTFQQLFTFAETIFLNSFKNTILNAPILFNNSYKAYFWTQLRDTNQLIFTENGITIDPTKLSYQDLNSSEKSLAVKASEDSQDDSLYGSLKTEKKNLSDNHKLVLTTVAKSRQQGIVQHRLGELLNMDTKTVFYYLKKLEQLGLVVKETAYIAHMNTRVIYLNRFSPQQQNGQKEKEDTSDVDYYRIETFKDDLFRHLSQAENQMMSLKDIVTAMGFVIERNARWAKVKICQLHDQGVIEKFIAYDGLKQKPSVRLVQQTAATVEKTDQPNPVQATIDISNQEHFLVDLPGDYQFYKDIVASGEKGLTRQELLDKYPMIDPDAFKSFFENVTSKPKFQDYAKYMIYRTEELNGKSRIYRYFDVEGWRLYNEKLEKTVVEPQITKTMKAPALEEPKSIDHIANAFGINPTRKESKKRSLGNFTVEANDDDDAGVVTSQMKRAKKLTARSAKIDNITTEIPVAAETSTIAARTRRQPVLNQAATIEETSSKRKLDQDDDDTQPTKKDYGTVMEFETKATVKRKKGNKKQPTEFNATKIRRHNLLLDLLEKQNIRELNKYLLMEINEIEASTEGGQKMAVMTLNNIAKKLHEEKKLRMFVSTIQKPHGLTEIKTFLLHSSLTENSIQVKRFIESYKMDKQMIVAGTKSKRELKKLDVQKLPSVSATDDAKNGMKDERIHMDNYIQNYAADYGWIKSKWLRARELHENLVQFYETTKSKDRIIDMTEYIKYMPVNVLIIICSSLPYDNIVLRNFLDVEENRSMSLSELPEEIRLIVFQVKTRIRFMINYLLEILQALEIITALDQSIDKHYISSKYSLANHGSVRDYGFKDRPLLSTIQLQSVADVKRFWEELHSVCVQHTQYRSEDNEKELDEHIDKNDPLFRIHRSRGWATDVVITEKQKKILNSFIDKEAMTIPSDDAPLRQHLIKETKLSAKRIRLYYTAFMSAMLKKKDREEKKKARLQKQLSMSADTTINDLMLASMQKRKIDAALIRMKEAGPFVQTTFVGSRRFRRLRLRVEPHQEQTHETVHSSIRMFNRMDPLQEDMLIYSYSIMKSRAEGKSFFWRPITQLFPEKTPEKCRRYMDRLLSKTTDTRTTVENLKSKWSKYYKEGIERNEIQDEKPWDTLDFDLGSFVEYFIIRMQQEQPNPEPPAQVPLPLSYKDVYEKFTVVSNKHSFKARKKNAKDIVTPSVSGKVDVFDMHSSVQKLQTDEISIQVVKTLIKMLLTTPDEYYNSEAAFNLLKNYCDEVVDKALNELKAEGLIVGNKSKYGSRVPGRSFNVSEKYLAIACGTLPYGLMADARAYYSKILSRDTMALKDISFNSGVAAVTLDLLSQYKITLCVEDVPKFIKSKESIYYPKASAVSLRQAYVYKDLNIAIKNNGCTNSSSELNLPPAPSGIISLPDTKQIIMHVHQVTKNNTLIKHVYDFVLSCGENGSSMKNIIKRLESTNTKRDEVIDAAHHLIHHQPPLLYVVGFNQLRYVTIEHVSCWLLKSGVINKFIKPLMWNDSEGNLIQSAFNGCTEVIISHILDQPGISYSDLQKRLEGFFTEYELHTLMEYLTDSETVISRKIQRLQIKPFSLFNKRRLQSPARYNSIEDCDVITYYWLSKNYYLLTQIKKQ